MLLSNNAINHLFPLMNLNFDEKSLKWELFFDCSKCQKLYDHIEIDSRYKINPECLDCLAKSFLKNNNKQIEVVEIFPNLKLPIEDLELIRNFSLIIKIIHKIQTLLEEFGKKTQDFTIISEIKQVINQNSNNYINILRNLELKFVEISSQDIKINKNLKKILKKYQSLQSNKFYQLFKKKYKLLNDIELLDNIFLGPNYLTKQDGFLERSNLCEYKKINQYIIDEFPLFKVIIERNNDVLENYYRINLDFGEKNLNSYFKISETIIYQINKYKFEDFLPIGEIINKFIVMSKKELNNKYKNLSKLEINNISIYCASKIVQLGKLFPLLVDNYIEEIYLDSPDGFLYLDHQIYGRCKTKIRFNSREIDSIKTLVRISSNKRLDYSNPSVKATINNQFFNSRFALDIEPLNLMGFSLDIRRMNKNIFTIPDLIRKNMLSCEIAAFLYFSIINRLNITVVGETSSGKTTLINALDLIVPRRFRKIYIEEAPESIDQNRFDTFQLKYIVQSDPHDKNFSEKTKEIYKLLHRNPDIVYLGEILTQNEAKAMFHCLSAGLRGFQTIHARDLDSLLNRWIYHFKIDPSCFNDTDIIILLKTKNSRRIISNVSELKYKNQKIEINTIYNFDPNSEIWINNMQVEQLKILDRLVISQNEKSEICFQLNLFTKLFRTLVQKEEISIEKQIRFIQNLSNFILGLKTQESMINWKKIERDWLKKLEEMI